MLVPDSSIDSTSNFFLLLLLVALKRKMLQKQRQKKQPIMEKFGLIRTYIDSKLANTGSRSILVSSIDFTNQMFIYVPQNRQKSPKIIKTPRTDGHMCRLQHWFQVQFDDFYRFY